MVIASRYRTSKNPELKVTQIFLRMADGSPMRPMKMTSSSTRSSSGRIQRSIRTHTRSRWKEAVSRCGHAMESKSSIIGTRKFFAVDVRTEPTFSWGKPSPLPLSGAVQTPNSPRNYDVTPEGKFLIVLPASQGENTQAAGFQVNVVLNWLEELKQRVPVR